jgi:hypothetical protein
MQRYHLRLATFTAEQWRRVGDLSGDKPLVNGEGRIVKTYHREGLDPNTPCSSCSTQLRGHGWIDPPAPPVDPTLAAIPVNPVSGARIAPPPPPPDSMFPHIFVKEGSPYLEVKNDAEAQAAFDDGYQPTPKPAEAPPPPERQVNGAVSDPSKQGSVLPKRGDANGLVICPGNMVITNDLTGEKSTMTKAAFDNTYSKVY